MSSSAPQTVSDPPDDVRYGLSHQNLSSYLSVEHPPQSAVTTGHSTPLGIFSTIWSSEASRASSSSKTLRPHDPALPSRSSGAFLEPLGAFRSRFRHKSATKTADTQTSLSSQPVVVRTYTAPRAAPKHSRSKSSPAMDRNAELPPVEAFAFDGILRAIEPEIQEALDAIAEICARSRMSLASEHSAHLPPQGEVTASARNRYSGVGARHILDHSLAAVPEASASSERLTNGSRPASLGGKSKTSAYGSLRSIISGKRSASESQHEDSEGTAGRSSNIQKTPVNAPSEDQALFQNLISNPTPSNHVSLETTTAVEDAPVKAASAAHHRQVSTSTGLSWAQSKRLSSSFASWMPWNREAASAATSTHTQEMLSAESKLKDLLKSSSSSKAKAAAGM